MAQRPLIRKDGKDRQGDIDVEAVTGLSAALASKAVIVISEEEPSNPVEGMLWAIPFRQEEDKG